jgi:hypothetical protein
MSPTFTSAFGRLFDRSIAFYLVGLGVVLAGATSLVGA